MVAEAPERDEAAEAAKAPLLELCRRRFLPFVKYVFPGFKVFPKHRLIADALEQFEQDVLEEKGPRLIINMGPRLGKSELVSRTYGPWILGRHPDWHMLLVSYGADLAEELSADARRYVMSDEYGDVFGTTYESEPGSSVELDRTSKAVGYWRLKGHRGGFRAVGVGGAITGRGANIAVFDDPLKGDKEADSHGAKEGLWNFYKGSFYTRFEPGGGIIVMATRWALDDLPGRLLKEAEENPAADQWKVINFPTQALTGHADLLGREPGEFIQARFTPEQLQRIKDNLPPRWWSAQYQGNPIPSEGQILHPYDWFTAADPPQENGREYIGPRYGFSDTSHAKNRDSDYSGILIVQVEPDGWLGILDCFRARVQYPELKKAAIDMYAKWKLRQLVVEDYSSGRALLQEFARNSGMKVLPYRPDRDKFARAHEATDVIFDPRTMSERQQLAAWKIRIPKGDRFPSGLPISVFMDELNQFQPGGSEHDDLVDCFTSAMYLIGTRNAMSRSKVLTGEFAFTP